MSGLVNFHAQWTPANVFLKPPSLPSSLIRRICLVIKNVLCCIPRWITATLSKRIFYPAALSSPTTKTYQAAHQKFTAFWKANINDPNFYQGQPNLSAMGAQGTFAANPYGLWAPYSKDVCKKILATYRPQEFTLKTPDECTIQGHYFQNVRASNPTARVILVFGGNGEIYPQGGSCAPIMELLHDHTTPYSFLLMYPRGVGTSSGKISPQGLLTDGESLYQYAQHLGYSEDRIDIYGQSMGGSVAAHVKSLHPETTGTVILDRTFSKLSHVAADQVKLFPLHPTRFVRWVCSATGWDLDNVTAVKKIKDPVYIYHHQNDWVMHHQGSLYSAFQFQRPSNVTLVTMENISKSTLSQVSFPDRIQFLQQFHLDPHLAPLPLCYKEGAPLSHNATDKEKNAESLCQTHLLQYPFATRA